MSVAADSPWAGSLVAAWLFADSLLVAGLSAAAGMFVDRSTVGAGLSEVVPCVSYFVVAASDAVAGTLPGSLVAEAAG